MVTCKDFYDLARQWADTNTGYNNGFGYQCIGLIDGLNRALGAGLSTYVRNDEAKNMYYDYASGAYHTAGWHTVAGDPRNDAKSKEVWNKLPNGAIVFWESSSQRYGHVAIKIANWGTPSGDVVQQDGANRTRPAHYFNSGAFTESGGMGFIGAIISDDSGWGQDEPQGSGGATTPSEPTQPSDAKEEAKKNFDEIINNFLDKMKELFNQNVYTASEQYMFNKVVKLTKSMNLWRVRLSDEALKELTNVLNDALKDASDDAIDSTKPDQSGNAPSTSVPEVTGGESTEDEKVELITKICKQYCPNANAFGIAGMLGNFAHESGIDPENFECRVYWDGNTEGASWQDEPTVENVFGSWGAFQALYRIPLNETIYRVGNVHYMGLGLGQWTGQRGKDLVDYCKKNGLQWWTCKGQMEFAFNGDGANIDILKKCLVNSEYVEEGVQNFYQYWERASVGSSVPHRNSEAKRLYPKVKAILDSL